MSETEEASAPPTQPIVPIAEPAVPKPTPMAKPAAAPAASPVAQPKAAPVRKAQGRPCAYVHWRSPKAGQRCERGGLYPGGDGKDYCVSHVKIASRQDKPPPASLFKAPPKTQKKPPTPEPSEDEEEEEVSPEKTEVKELDLAPPPKKQPAKRKKPTSDDDATSSEEELTYEQLKAIKERLRSKYEKKSKRVEKKKKKRQALDLSREVGAGTSPAQRWKRALRNSRSIQTLGQSTDVPKTRMLDHRFI